MAKLDPVVRKETGYVAGWVAALSLLLEAVFLVLRRWDLSVLAGNLAGGLTAVGNYLLLGLTVSGAVSRGDTPQKIALRVRSSRTLRMLGIAGICALCVGVLKTNVYATVIPLLFPRIGLAFRPLIDKKRNGNGAAAPKETEEGNLID